MRINDSKSSPENVCLIASVPKNLSKSVAGIFEVAPVPSPLGEGPERLLFAIRASFDRLFQPNRHWNQFPQVTCFESQTSCFQFPDQHVANPFVAAHAAYRESLGKLLTDKGRFEADRAGKLDGASLARMRQSHALSRNGHVQSLLSDANRLLRSDDPRDQIRAHFMKLKAFHLLQLISKAIGEARWFRTSYQ